MNSGDSTVGISEPGKEERTIMTSYKNPFQRNEYTHFTLGPGQSVKMFGEAVVLFYRLRRIAPAPTPTPNLPSNSNLLFNTRDTHRLQINSSGHFSTPYPKSCIRSKNTTEEFFTWFAHQTSHCLPHGPERMRFTFKDAIPVLHSSEIGKGNEEYFIFMRRDIKRMWEVDGRRKGVWGAG